MRWSLLLLLLAIPTLALAEPKVAVAKLEGDPKGNVADIIAEVAGDRAKVTKPGRVESAMRGLGVSALNAKSTKKLRARLGVDVVIHGSVQKDGRDTRVRLVLSGKGSAKLSLVYESTKELRKDRRAKLPKRIAAAMESGGGNDEDDDDDRKRDRERKQQDQEAARDKERRAEAERKQRAEDESRRAESDRKRKKKRGGGDDEDDEDGDRKRKKKRVAEDDDRSRTRKRFRDDDDDDDDDDDRRRKRKRRGDDEDERPRHAITQAAVWADVGGALARRTLTWSATGATPPPRVGTFAPAGRFEAELYPLALTATKGPATGIGLHADYSRTFGLGIAVPGMANVVAPIKNGHYSVGARYRFVFGQHSLAIGASYWRRYYMADRSKLTTPDQLDMPDVDYSAIAPGVLARIAATPKIGAFASIDVPLMLYSGPIQEPGSYGSSKILAFDLRAGAQIAVASRAALQIAADVSQVGLTFTQQMGSMAATRNVTKATDRSVGLSATIGIVY